VPGRFERLLQSIGGTGIDEGDGVRKPTEEMAAELRVGGEADEVGGTCRFKDGGVEVDLVGTRFHTGKDLVEFGGFHNGSMTW
jgi:hypothetical protein